MPRGDENWGWRWCAWRVVAVLNGLPQQAGRLPRRPRQRQPARAAAARGQRVLHHCHCVANREPPGAADAPQRRLAGQTSRHVACQQTIQLTERRAPCRPPAAPVGRAPSAHAAAADLVDSGYTPVADVTPHASISLDVAAFEVRGEAPRRGEKRDGCGRVTAQKRTCAQNVARPCAPPAERCRATAGTEGGGGVRAPEAPKAAAAAARAALGAPGAAGGRRVLQGLQTALPRRAPPACSKRCTQQPCAWQAALACRAAPACLSTLRLTRTAFRTRAIPHRARSARTPATTRARRMCTRTAATRPRATASAR